MSGSIDRLTSLDRLMLRASERWPQDIGALATLGVSAKPTSALEEEASA